MKKMISIVTPCYNEKDSIEECYETVRNICESGLGNYDHEHIFCDNASTDGTLAILKKIAMKDKRVKIIANARNFGPARSTFNGVLNSRGDAVLVFLPADLQDPPELLVEFVKRWEEGYQVVRGVRKKREENFLMSFIRKVYYRVINKFADFHIPPDVGDFQLVDRIVVESLKKVEDYYPYVRGLIANCGFNSIEIEYVWKSRKKGFSKNKFYNLIDQGINGILSFTNVPLRLCMLFGFVISGLSISYAIFSFIENLIFYRRFAPPGIATLIVAIFFFAGVQLFFIGLLGEYVGAIHFQVRKRPLVVEREKINF